MSKSPIRTAAESRLTWEKGKANAGYPEGTPPWLSTWLMIITDNTLHMGINHYALKIGKK